MALMPGVDTGQAAQVGHQLEMERQAREQFREGMLQRDRELALQAFQASQVRQIQRMEQKRIWEHQRRQQAQKMMRDAVELGVKLDPASNQYRPLTESDAEYTAWKENQADRLARRPLTPERQIEVAGKKAEAVERAREPWRRQQLEARSEQFKQRLEAQGEQFKQQQEARKQEAKARADEWIARFEMQQEARAKEAEARAEAQAEMAKLRHWGTMEAIKLRAKLRAPEVKAKALSAKQKEEDKARESGYFKAQAALDRAAKRVQEAVKLRNQMAEKLWPGFKEQHPVVRNWWPDRDPTTADVAPGGVLANEWNKLMALPNQGVQRAQKQYQDAERIYDRARDAYLGVPAEEAVPTREEMDRLIKKHGGDWKAAEAEWNAMRKAK